MEFDFRNGFSREFLSKMESGNSLIRFLNDRRLDVESRSLKIVHVLDTILEENVSDSKIRISIGEMKAEARALKGIITNSGKFDENGISIDRVQFEQKIQSFSNDIAEKFKKLNDEILFWKKKFDEKNSQSVKGNIVKNHSSNLDNEEISSLSVTLHQTQADLQIRIQENIEMSQELIEKRNQLRNYREMCAEYDDVKEQLHSIVSQKRQIEEFNDTLNQENQRLIKENKSLKDQIINGTSVESLNLQIVQLKEELNSQQIKIEQEKEHSKRIQDSVMSINQNKDAELLKSEILIEEISSLKTEVVEKEKSVNDMKKKVLKCLRRMELIQANHKIVVTENEGLKEQVSELRKERFQLNQDIIDLKTQAENFEHKIKGLNIDLESEKAKTSEQKSKSNDLSVKLSKYLSSLKELKTTVQEKEMKIGELEGTMKMLETENNDQKDRIRLLLNVKKDKDEFERKLEEAILDNANLRKSLKSSQENTRALNETIETLSNDLNKTKIMLSSLEETNNKERYENKNTIARINSQLKELTKENELLNKKIKDYVNQKDEIERDFERMKQSTNEKVRLMTNQHNESEQSILLKSKEQENQILILNQNLQGQIQKCFDMNVEISKYCSFVQQVGTILSETDENSILDSIRSIIEVRNNSLILLKSINNEIKRIFNLFSVSFQEVGIDTSESSPIKCIENIQEFIRKLLEIIDEKNKQEQSNENEKSKIARCIGVAQSDAYEDIRQSIEVLKTKNRENEIIIEKQSTLLDNLKELSSSESIEDLYSYFYSLKKDNQNLKTLFERKNQEYEYIITQNTEIENRMSNFINSVSSALKCKPSLDLAQEITKLKLKKAEFHKLISKLMNLAKVSELSQLYQTIEAEHNKLVSYHRNEELIAHDHQIGSIDEISSYVTKMKNKISVIEDELSQEKRKYFELVSSLMESVNCEKEVDLISFISHINNENKSLKEELNLIRETIGNSESIIEHVTYMQNEIADMRQCSNQISESISNKFGSQYISDISGFMTTIKHSEDLMYQLLISIISVISKKPESEIRLSFPFTEHLSHAIIEIVKSYSGKMELLQEQSDLIIAKARKLGYVGESYVDASEYIAEENARRKSTEILENTIEQLRELREDKDKEREVFEKRISTANSRMNELRNQKTAAVENALQIQTDLNNRIEFLEKELRTLNDQLLQKRRLIEELLRLVSNEPYDKELIQANIDQNISEKIKFI